VTEPKKTSLIPNRVFLIGEQYIPSEELDKISDEHINVFLKEPNPKKWPPEIAHLKKHLPHVEQMKWELYEIMESHEMLLGDSLERWSIAVWKDFGGKRMFPEVQTEDIFNELAVYLKELIEKYISNNSEI